MMMATMIIGIVLTGLKESRVAPKKTSLKLLNVIVLPSSNLLRERYVALTYGFAEPERLPLNLLTTASMFNLPPEPSSILPKKYLEL
jgi:hypothetical protein